MLGIASSRSAYVDGLPRPSQVFATASLPKLSLPCKYYLMDQPRLATKQTKPRTIVQWWEHRSEWYTMTPVAAATARMCARARGNGFCGSQAPCVGVGLKSNGLPLANGLPQTRNKLVQNYVD